MQPYIEMSSVLASAGRRDIGNDVQFAGRLREHDNDWEQHSWTGYVKWAWLTFLLGVAGFGIGIYTFIALVWVLLVTLLGAHILRFFPTGPTAPVLVALWRGPASAIAGHRDQQGIQGLFDNPAPQFDEERNLSRKQTGYFAVHAVIGWVLSFFLLAAMGGLIQKS